MANQKVMIVGGGLAGLSAAMKLAELGVQVELMSLTPVKRSHSVCAQGGINSVNEVTRCCPSTRKPFSFFLLTMMDPRK